ncbi:MAG: hypothetical protein DYG93_12685 [Leptolyngbya sp. PLA2]|nr:hypothetical protein [Leptolyngbya sp.]MCE7972501.1 hypothetical protein [Leptolyngbya sp. PL-A2]MCQ3941116.1 hypothetical protein [cyanobacterium CYA1]MCZ7633182.1 hypothetical protein [Phycisphaerales bacterium]MDL1905399.1 hypothetical protein [Synechococcales cyanobacterium CNB]GIK18340.1 MAG: hypothetical protein BroJett004_05040 [Planctomycetota bacterium]
MKRAISDAKNRRARKAIANGPGKPTAAPLSIASVILDGVRPGGEPRIVPVTNGTINAGRKTAGKASTRTITADRRALGERCSAACIRHRSFAVVADRRINGTRLLRSSLTEAGASSLHGVARFIRLNAAKPERP